MTGDRASRPSGDTAGGGLGGARGAVAMLALSAAWLAYRQPRWLLRALGRRSPDVLYYVDTERPLVALTIDDGPSREGMPRILDVLAEHGARATFFMISSHVRGHEDLVRRALDEGHEIANHMTSDRISALLGTRGFVRDLLSAEAVLREFGGLRWFRPGSGIHTGEMRRAAAALGYRMALASVYVWDSRIPSVSLAAHKVAAHSDPGGIVLLHDGPARGPRTAAVLERALPVLHGRGLRMVTLSALADAAEEDGRSATVSLGAYERGTAEPTER